MKYLPLTPGLLVSMALRWDHAFLANINFGPVETSEEQFISQQIRTLRDMRNFYDHMANGEEYKALDITGSPSIIQIAEEMAGIGFYNAYKEEIYRSYITNYTLRIELDNLCQPAIKGPMPTITTVHPLDEMVRLDEEMGLYDDLKFPDHARVPTKDLFFD